MSEVTDYGLVEVMVEDGGLELEGLEAPGVEVFNVVLEEGDLEVLEAEVVD